MNAHERLKQEIFKRPTSNKITAKGLKQFLDSYGFILKHTKGDHFIYSYPSGSKNIMLNIPMSSPVKPTYIDSVRKAIMEIEENEKL